MNQVKAKIFIGKKAYWLFMDNSLSKACRLKEDYSLADCKEEIKRLFVDSNYCSNVSLQLSILTQPDETEEKLLDEIEEHEKSFENMWYSKDDELETEEDYYNLPEDDCRHPIHRY